MMTRKIQHRERPISVRLQLWWLGKVEVLVLKHVPKGPFA